MIKVEEAARTRFEEKISPEPNSGCWLWTAGVSARYGSFDFSGRTMRAHRAAWLFYRGPIPGGLWVLHKCDNPLCVNPDHLWLGDVADNTQDAAQKQRLAAGERHGRAVLTDAQAAWIRRSYKPRHSKFGARAMARRLGVSRHTVNKILAGETYQAAIDRALEESETEQ